MKDKWKDAIVGGVFGSGIGGLVGILVCLVMLVVMDVLAKKPSQDSPPPWELFDFFINFGQAAMLLITMGVVMLVSILAGTLAGALFPQWRESRKNDSNVAVDIRRKVTDERCLRCDSPMSPNTAICTKCGWSFMDRSDATAKTIDPDAKPQ